MSKHTPGPWFVREVDDGREPRVFVTRDFGVNDAPRFYIAFIPSAGEGPEEAVPNARLIAAAPAMLEALNDIIARNEIQNWFNLDKARAAVALAQSE